MSGLTKAQYATLAACPDWSSPYEVAIRRHNVTGEIVSGIGQQAHLTRLRNKGLVEYGAPNGTYRITPAGRAAVAQDETP